MARDTARESPTREGERRAGRSPDMAIAIDHVRPRISGKAESKKYKGCKPRPYLRVANEEWDGNRNSQKDSGPFDVTVINNNRALF